MLQFFKNLFREKEQTKETEEQCCIVEKEPAAGDIIALAPETFHDLLQQQPEIKLIDVRQLEEYNEGHIQGAKLLPVQELSQERIETLNVKKDDEILLYCRSGGRSGQALQTMNMLGYKNVKHLDGGILVWKERNFPVEKP